MTTVQSDDPLFADSAGLTPRAKAFLRECAVRLPLACDPVEDALEAQQISGWFGVADSELLESLGFFRERFGGIQYLSRSWSFEEVIGFAPALDCDEGDPEPMASLIEHSVAHPYGVWMGMSGRVYFMFPQPGGAEYVHAFDHPEDLIESDALHAEVSAWQEVAVGGADSIEEVSRRCERLVSIQEGSGRTESWWQGPGFRVHVSRTMAEVFEREALARWAVWADSPDGRQAAQRHLAGLSY